MQASEKTRRYEILMAAVISARATSFLFNKLILEDLSPFNLLAVRFLIAFGLLAILFHRELRKMTRRTLCSGIAVGIMFFITMSFEMLALRQAASSLVSLLENCAIIFVPVMEVILFRKKLGRTALASTGVAMLGVFLLAVQQGGLQGGFTLGILSGVCYALAIITTDRMTAGSDAALSIGIIQVGTMGTLALGAALLVEQPQLPETGSQWLMLSALILVCTGFGFTLQPVAQKHLTAERAGVFCALSPAIAALLGVVVLREHLGSLGWAGLMLILSSILLPYLVPKQVK